MDPERAIEKLLRAFAKKRRDQAGPPLELHSATRRLLQNEAARRAPKPAGGNFFQTLAAVLRPRLAVIVGVAVIAFVGGSILLPMFHHGGYGRSADQKSLASAPALFKSDRLDVASPRDQEKDADAKLKDGAVDHFTNAASADIQVAAAADERSNSTGTFALAGDSSGVLNQLQKAQPAPAVNEPSAPPKAETAETRSTAGSTAGFAGAATELPARYFSRLEVLADKKQAEFIPVLTRFQVEQNGREIRIVDGDGSIYTGALVADAAALVTQSRMEPVRAAAPATVAPPAAPTFSFRVAGTNRSLNQQVVFVGKLLDATNRSPSLPSAPTGTAVSREPVLNLNLRISGHAVIDGKKEVEINAAPAKP